ncbi:RHD3/Sey1 [Polychytrium aggregatum]|uniref:RHD3/Sey1 n=1 Tax=Polychytrium aggregatum TaxID=110093 RepID=UPI0022FEF5EE|nr:RHD3/Sey1 [Polychytrium aggregatum]KAI9208330.1 RHD3/Sey1 [Polychytrium aggregatum]
MATVPDIDNRDLDDSALSPELPEDDPRLQIIKEDQQFNDQLASHLSSNWKLKDAGFDYHIMAVLGSQNSGKSTLLNQVFGTNFDVMNAKLRRSQTTKGIWMSRAEQSNVLVMDVEGTDGDARWEDQDFERKSALFSLAISEVLLVNMWENVVALYNGANMALLKIVFEVNLQLFQSKGSPKTLLLFVIRDFDGETPMETLSETLKGNLNRAWAGLNKPPGKENSTIEEFFDFEFVGLPHKRHRAADFDKEAHALQQRFIDKSNPQYVFHPRYHKHIPADGFPEFARSIWSTILSNKDLDLPSQRQLLAQYRCDEIGRACFNQFTSQIAKFKTDLESGKVVEGLGREVEGKVEGSLETFDHDASRYDREVYSAKRADFIKRIHSIIESFFVQQLRNAHKKALSVFTTSLGERAKGETGSFVAKLTQARDAAEVFFMKTLRDVTVSGLEWSTDEYVNQFKEELGSLVSQKKLEAMAAIQHSMEKKISEELSDQVAEIFDESAPDMWRKLFTKFRNLLESQADILQEKYSGFDCTSEEIQGFVNKLKVQVYEILLRTIKLETTDDLILNRARTRFEKKFRYDDQGQPRIWTPLDDIQSVCKAAKDNAESLFSLYAVVDFPVAEIDNEIIESESFSGDSLKLLSSRRKIDLVSRLQALVDALVVEAKRSIVSQTTSIPTWFVVLTIILGWNEFIAILRSPIFFTVTALLIGASYLTWYLGMSGVVLKIMGNVVKDVGHQVTDKLEEHGVHLSDLSDTRGLVNTVQTLMTPARNATAPAVATPSSPPPRYHTRISDASEYELQTPTKKSSGLFKPLTDEDSDEHPEVHI